MISIPFYNFKKQNRCCLPTKTTSQTETQRKC